MDWGESVGVCGDEEGVPRICADGEVVSSLAGEVVPEKKTAYWIEYASAHFHHVLHDFPDWGVGDGHVYGADGDHEVETGDDVAGVLDELIEICEVVS